MDLPALHTFISVIEQGGILAASRHLNTVQSNVTSRIKRLEETLDTQLFYRQGRGLVLSPSGQVLESYARRMLQLEIQATQAVRQAGNQSGELRIGTMESFAALRLSPILQQLRHDHPGLQLQISTNTTADLIQDVLQHKLDCAFVGGPVEHPDIQVSQVIEEELVLVSSNQSGTPAISQLPLILFRDGCAYRTRALNWQRHSGNHTQQLMEMGSLDGILSCVAAGLGCTLLPAAVVAASSHHPALHTEQLPTELGRVPTLMIQHKDALPLPALKDLSVQVSQLLSEQAV
ncbi:LysR family transcriptional regulator [Aliamphritea spongicola]|uniref:LysR family transcriptional regulator n=1 Tax=Aliamphritea spongicola TaxID=707589 RepID=UPI00196AE9AD|nr:LysR family transcriptional regulator [Aliamphritea spongicola]MBN3564280.1 LysR family transcriptional regulator [Aliamphritea spongicola]